jgi:hypothetical protein
MAEAAQKGFSRRNTAMFADEYLEFNIRFEDLKLGGKIGKGAFSEVYSGEYHGEKVLPCLYVFVVRPFSVGRRQKGTCDNGGQKVHDGRAFCSKVRQLSRLFRLIACSGPLITRIY